MAQTKNGRESVLKTHSLSSYVAALESYGPVLYTDKHVNVKAFVDVVRDGYRVSKEHHKTLAGEEYVYSSTTPKVMTMAEYKKSNEKAGAPEQPLPNDTVWEMARYANDLGLFNLRMLCLEVIELRKQVRQLSQRRGG